jgi:hypothetical protein
MGTEEDSRSAGAGISSGESRSESRSDRKKYKDYREVHHESVGTQYLEGMSIHLECPAKRTSIEKLQKPMQNMLDKR